MHGSRKPRLPIQAEYLATLYPNAGEFILGESARDEEILELVNSTEEVQMKHQDIAGKSLTQSKVVLLLNSFAGDKIMGANFLGLC